MKRQRQKLEDIVSSLTQVDANWLDEHASNCIQLLRRIPEKKTYSRKDIENLLSTDFHTASTVVRLFLDVSKDEMTVRMKEKLGAGGIGIKRFKKDPEDFLDALCFLGLPQKMKAAVNTPLQWSDLLVERLKGGRGSAIKGQQRGRGLEDFTEELLLQIFDKEQIDTRCRFVSVDGQSTEKTDFAIPSRDDPHILIEAKAYGATGSKQTDILGDIARIVDQKRRDTVMLLFTDGITWRERLSDLQKLVELQNKGSINRIYTRAMAQEFLADLKQLKDEFEL
ncbi:DpnII family type II restriction endonuclease [Pontiellaceae bacterium B12227]|nr:DpnII family type II restriction endonuclease [Pontiellaceae bacterium B12227]